MTLQYIGKESCIHGTDGWIPIQFVLKAGTQEVFMVYLWPCKCTLFLNLCWFFLLSIRFAVLSQEVSDGLLWPPASDAVQGVGHGLNKKPPCRRAEMFERALNSNSSNISTFLQIRTVLLKEECREMHFSIISEAFRHYFLRVLQSITSVPCFTSQLGEICSLSLIQYQHWLAK